MRPLSSIAHEVFDKWGEKVYFGARPYLEAMLELNTISDNYMADSGESVVLYAMSNMANFRGEDARRLKAELKEHLKK